MTCLGSCKVVIDSFKRGRGKLQRIFHALLLFLSNYEMKLGNFKGNVARFTEWSEKRNILYFDDEPSREAAF